MTTRGRIGTCAPTVTRSHAGAAEAVVKAGITTEVSYKIDSAVDMVNRWQAAAVTGASVAIITL